jgi:hypothetical protein
MQIRPAKDVRAKCVGDLSCPEPLCGTRFSPTGRHKPVLVDDSGRPYCATHGPTKSPVFEELVDTYSDARQVVADAVAAGQMTQDDAQNYYDLWNGPQMDA